ncbi:MAG: hypothetical protein FD143_2003 [Ignavibacteria bacterium]|nr:MAG: hypothetical protein FD143_2003 [Ignavibacteria bacterium]KAF0159143.1 MAG: hypothetical protein FD188_2306 [Ignavibacteria bacterium]
MKSFLLLALLVISAASLLAQTNKEEKKNVRVVVMPYDRFERFPYRFDLIRESLQLGLMEKGFTVVNDDTTWSIILEKDYALYNLSQLQADTIINIVNADLIVFGNADNFQNNRLTGLYSEKKISRPILVKVFDKRKHAIVLHERIDFIQHWGLNVKELSFRDFGIQTAYKLKQLGY